jgi:20S proteasome alpha/beta subunit
MRVHEGTLVVVVPTRDGLVFLADREDSDVRGRSAGVAQKVEVVDDRFAFAVSGTAGVDDRDGRGRSSGSIA